jgi:hypothetical protein
MATEAEIIASNILASAIEYKRLYDTTKKNEYKVKEQRLRQIAENIKLIVAPGSTSSVSSFNGRTGAVTLTSADVTGALGYTPLATVPTLAQVTTAGNTTTNAITVGDVTSTGVIKSVVSSVTAQFTAVNPAGNYPRAHFQIGQSAGDNNVGLVIAPFYSSAGVQKPAFVQVSTNKNTLDSGQFSGYFIINTSTFTIGSTKVDGTVSGGVPIIFAPAATEAMRIQNNGNIQIGTTTDAGYKLDVAGDIRTQNAIRILNPAFTNGGSITHSANSTLVVTGGPGGGSENITFGPSNRIFINASQTWASQTFLIGGASSVGAISNPGNFSAIHLITGTSTAASAIARAQYINTTLTASANNDVLVGLDINPTFTNGAFTGVTNLGLRSFSGFNLHSYGVAGGNNGHYLYAVTNNISATDGLLHFRRGGGYNGITRFQLGGSFQLSSDDNTGEVRMSAGAGGYYSTFYSNGFEAMRIPTSRNVLIGTTTDAGYKLDVVGADSRFNGVRVGLGAGGVSTNTVVGTNALANNTTGLSNTAVGNGSLRYNIDGSYNTAYGVDSLNANTGGGSNVAVGWRALISSLTGYSNVAIGTQALFNNTASNNTAVGTQSLYSNVSGISLTAVGYQALNLNTGSYNTAVGEQALQNNTTGGFNAAFGTWALKANTTASYNSAFGQASLYVNTTGVNNSAYGNGSLFSNTTGGNNTSIGRASMFSNISGGSNVAVGVNSLYNSTASNNTAVGYQAGYAGVANTTGSNNIFIGYQATGVLATESNRTWIGNSSTTSTWLAGNVLIGTTTDAGHKLDVNGTARVQGAFTATLANVSTANVVYYNTTTGLFTYGAAPGGGGGGTVTSVGLSSATSGVTIGATPVTTSGTITIAIATASGSQNGLLSSTDWTTFNNKQNALTLTTTGSSGAATLIGGVLNIPNYGSALTGYVPYTGATTDVNLGTYQLLAARGTFSNNGSTNTLTVDHTSGSGYGIIVTKGGANEALYVNKTSGSGNAMTVVGGRTSLVDLALSSVSNAAGDFLTLNGGVVHRRTAAQVLSDISVPTPTLAQVTTAGNTTTNSITVGGLTVDTNTLVVDATNNRVGIGIAAPTDKLHIVDSSNANIFGRITATGTNASAAWVAQNDQVDNVVYRVFGSGVSGSQMGIALARSASLLANLGGSGKFLVGTFSSTDFVLGTGNTERARFVDSTGNFLIGTTSDNGNKLQVNGTIDGQAFALNGVTGWTGMIMIPFNPPGMQNIDVQGGIIMNVF